MDVQGKILISPNIWNITWLLTSKSSIYSHQSFFWTPDLAASGTSFLMCPRSLIRFFNILTSLWRFGCCTWQKNIFAQEHWGCRNIHSGVFAAAIITSTLPTPGDLLDWRSRFILANHSRLLYRLYSLFRHCIVPQFVEETVEEEKDTVNFSSPPERRFAQRILEFARDMCICCSLWMELLFMKKRKYPEIRQNLSNNKAHSLNTECPKKLPFWNFSKINPLLF